MTLAWPLVAVSLVLGTRSTVGAAAPPRVVLNEIHYHPASDLQTDEFLELHNAGATPVSLAGWTLRGGLEFAFPESAAIEPGAYLVLARDPARIAELHALDVSGILGPWVGALANEGETIELADGAGSTVDRIPYLDAYPWPEAPDGGGPSLERIDTSRRGDTPRNWAASGNGGWIDIHLAGTASSSRLYLYLEGAGECFIDDLVVTQSSAPGNLLPDGGFEAGLDGWVSSGNHAGSVRSTLDAASGSASLRIVATGAGRGASDGLTIEVPGLGGGAASTLDFRARPREGNSSLISRISGGGLIGRSDLRRLEGTPGRENSVRGTALPPLVAFAGTEPGIPAPGEAVVLLASVEDEDLSSVRATYDAGAGPIEIALRDDGLSGDGLADDGLFAATLPGYPLGTIVEYRVTAIDAGGLRVETPPRRYPVSGPLPESKLPVYSIFVRPADWDRLNADIWSEEYVPAVFVHDGVVRPDAGLRFRGGRPRLFRKKSLKLSFTRENPFDERNVLNLNAAAMDDDYLTEPLAYWFYERAGVAASRARFVRVELNGEFWGLFIDVEQVNERYLSHHGMDPDGALYKAVGIVSSLRKLDGILYQGVAYSYPSQYEKKTREGEPYDELVSLIDGLYSTPAPGMEAYLEGAVEVDRIVDYLAVTHTLAVWDSIQHNFYLYRDSEGNGKWRIIPWDLDHAWGEWEWNYYSDSTYPLFMGIESRPFAGVWYTWNKLWTVLLEVPSYRTRYLDRMRAFLNTIFAEGPLFRKIDEMRSEIESTVLLDEAKWPDSLEPLHTGPRRTFIEELPVLRRAISDRRRYLAGVLGVTLETVPPATRFRRGDVDSNGALDISDALALLWFLYLGGNGLACDDAADSNDDGNLDIADAASILGYLFRGDAPPPAPGAIACGEDPTIDGLDCDVSPCR